MSRIDGSGIDDVGHDLEGRATELVWERDTTHSAHVGSGQCFGGEHELVALAKQGRHVVAPAWRVAAQGWERHAVERHRGVAGRREDKADRIARLDAGTATDRVEVLEGLSDTQLAAVARVLAHKAPEPRPAPKPCRKPKRKP